MPDQVKGSAFCRPGEAKVDRQKPAFPSRPSVFFRTSDCSMTGCASADHMRAAGIIFCKAKRPDSCWGAVGWVVLSAETLCVPWSQPTSKNVATKKANKLMFFMIITFGCWKDLLHFRRVDLVLWMLNGACLFAHGEGAPMDPRCAASGLATILTCDDLTQSLMRADPPCVPLPEYQQAFASPTPWPL